MSDEALGQNIDFSVNIDNLYREENITDLKVATIRKLVPVKPDGTKDENRTALFFGHSQLVSPQGPVPLQGQLMANNLKEAIEVFPTAMKKSLDELVKQIKQMQQQKEQEQQKQEQKKQE